jgi:hypothetical protein
MAIARHAFVGNYGLSVGRIFGETLPSNPVRLARRLHWEPRLPLASDARMPVVRCLS